MDPALCFWCNADSLVCVCELSAPLRAASRGSHLFFCLHSVSDAATLTRGLHVRSMAVGEFISVSSQRDSEEADVEKERVEQAKGAHRALQHVLPVRPGVTSATLIVHCNQKSILDTPTRSTSRVRMPNAASQPCANHSRLSGPP